MTEKLKSYFNIFECGRNILDQLDVTYQRAFMSTPAENDYYKEMLKNPIKVNNEDGIKCIEKLQSHFANMTFADKSRYDRTFQQRHTKCQQVQNLQYHIYACYFFHVLYGNIRRTLRQKR